MGAESFLEPRDCGYWAVGTCLSLDSRVNVFREGYTGESPCQSFPALMLERVDNCWGSAPASPSSKTTMKTIFCGIADEA